MAESHWQMRLRAWGRQRSGQIVLVSAALLLSASSHARVDLASWWMDAVPRWTALEYETVRVAIVRLDDHPIAFFLAVLGFWIASGLGARWIMKLFFDSFFATLYLSVGFAFLFLVVRMFLVGDGTYAYPAIFALGMLLGADRVEKRMNALRDQLNEAHGIRPLPR